MRKIIFYLLIVLPPYASAKDVDPYLIINGLQEFSRKSKSAPQKAYLNCKWVESNISGYQQSRKCNNKENCLDINILEKCEGFIICEKSIDKHSQDEESEFFFNKTDLVKKYHIRCPQKNNLTCDATKCFEERE